MHRFALLWLIASLSVSQSAQANGLGCLQVGHSDTQAVFNLNTGTVRKFTLPYLSGLDRGQSNDYAEFVFSPDHRHAAYIRADAAVGNTWPLGTLLIAPVNAFGELGQPAVVRTKIVVPFTGGMGIAAAVGTEFQWSPDSRYLFYRWQLGNPEFGEPATAQYVALATPDGQTLRMVTLPTQPVVNMGTFSADGQFISLAIGDYDLTKTTLLEIPDLKVIDLIVVGYQATHFLCTSIVLSNECPAWSPTGHQFAVIGMDAASQPHVLVMNAGQSNPVADFASPVRPEKGMYQVIIWSPDGQNFALYAFDVAVRISAVRIDIFSVRGPVPHVIATHRAHMDDFDGFPYLTMAWCDNQHMFYIDNDTNVVVGFALPGAKIPSTRTTHFSFYDEDHLEAGRIISSDCANAYRLEQVEDNGVAAQIINLTTQQSTVLSRNKTAKSSWYGSTAVAAWPGGLAWASADGTNFHTPDTSVVASDSPTIEGVSPAGRWLAFKLGADLFVADVHTGTYQLLVKDVTDAHFSSDGHTLLVNPGSPTSDGVVGYLFPMGGGASVVARYAPMPGDNQQVLWSPDGSLFTVISQTADTSVAAVFQRSGQLVAHFNVDIGYLQAEKAIWYPTCTP